jgi:hypothetical protein
VRTSAAKASCASDDAAAGRREREHGGFDEHLADEHAAVGAERAPHGHLARAALAAHEQKIRDVRARDEQKASDRAEHQQQRGPDGGGRLVGRGDREGHELHRLGYSRSATNCLLRSVSCALA